MRDKIARHSRPSAVLPARPVIRKQSHVRLAGVLASIVAEDPTVRAAVQGTQPIEHFGRLMREVVGALLLRGGTAALPLHHGCQPPRYATPTDIADYAAGRVDETALSATIVSMLATPSAAIHLRSRASDRDSELELARWSPAPPRLYGLLRLGLDAALCAHPPDRQRAHRIYRAARFGLGREAERVASAVLRARGFRVVALDAAPAGDVVRRVALMLAVPLAPRDRDFLIWRTVGPQIVRWRGSGLTFLRAVGRGRR